uniref:EGF-like domain-containing protein n=1 Tax=Panagrolaimus sp. PS1159 TaxID=55785 RepID=A0AC35GBR8_9BILA
MRLKAIAFVLCSILFYVADGQQTPTPPSAPNPILLFQQLIQKDKYSYCNNDEDCHPGTCQPSITLPNKKTCACPFGIFGAFCEKKWHEFKFENYSIPAVAPFAPLIGKCVFTVAPILEFTVAEPEPNKIEKKIDSIKCKQYVASPENYEEVCSVPSTTQAPGQQTTTTARTFPPIGGDKYFSTHIYPIPTQNQNN